jgi:hypothetical protein
MSKRTLMGFSAASFDKAYRQFQADAEPVESPTRASDPTPSEDCAGFAAGDVLFARISRVKIHASAQSDSPQLSQLDKHEKVICLGENQGRFLKVRSANAEGWVDESLLTRH